MAVTVQHYTIPLHTVLNNDF